MACAAGRSTTSPNSWTVIGLKDYAWGTRVTPAMELVLADERVCRPLVGHALVPIGYRWAKTLRDGYLPIVRCQKRRREAITHTVEAFACPPEPGTQAPDDWPTHDNLLNLLRITLADESNRPARGHVGLALQAKSGPPACRMRGECPPDTVAIESDLGLAALVTPPPSAQADLDRGLARIAVDLQAHETATVRAVPPFVPVSTPTVERLTALADLDVDAFPAGTASFWKGWLDRGFARGRGGGDGSLNDWGAGALARQRGVGSADPGMPQSVNRDRRPSGRCRG
jgi:hypothetical protein